VDNLTYELRQLCLRNRDNSYDTQAGRMQMLTQVSRELRELGYRHMRARSLKLNHVEALVKFWLDSGLAPATIKNRLVQVRWWAEKVGKTSEIPKDNARFGIPDRRFVTNQDKAKQLGKALDRVRDPHVRLGLEMQQKLGLRRKECLLIRPETGGRAKYLLSGVLVCATCGANYVIADARSYACSGHWNGGACSNRIRVRRGSIERTLLGPIRADLLSPERCKQMVKDMHTAYAERAKANAQRVETLPQETAALDARLERLRERLKRGDLDMTPDELQATIERVEAKRRELTTVTSRTIAGDGTKIISLLPKAAEYYGQQISLGLDGDPRAAAKARPIVRELLGGKVQLVPGEDGSLWAEYGLQMSALLHGAGTCGRGEAI
jgi:hypothetical protein